MAGLLGEVWARAVELARRQHWVVARWQLLRLGLTEPQIDHRLGTGAFNPLHRGVYAVGRRDVSRRGRWLAAVLACGEGAVLSHTSAAALWELRAARPGPIHVTSRHKRGRSDPALALHRSASLRPTDVVVREGIPVTGLGRTLTDLAAVLDADALRDAFEEADRLNILELRPLAALATRGRGLPGLGVLRSLIAEASAPDYTRSELERRFLPFCRRHGLPMPEVNANVAGFEVDAMWRDARLVVELDSWAFHGRTRDAFERDRERDAALAVAGYRVYRLTWRRLHEDGAAVAAELVVLVAQTTAAPRA